MAAALGISSRTLSRWLRELHVEWPPLDRDAWQALASQAQRAPTEELPTWVVVFTTKAANLSELEAKLASDITILRIARLSPEETDA